MAFQRSYSKVWWGSRDEKLPFGPSIYYGSISEKQFKTIGNLSKIHETDENSKLWNSLHESPGSLRSQVFTRKFVCCSIYIVLRLNYWFIGPEVRLCGKKIAINMVALTLDNLLNHNWFHLYVHNSIELKRRCYVIVENEMYSRMVIMDLMCEGST